VVSGVFLVLDDGFVLKFCILVFPVFQIVLHPLKLSKLSQVSMTMKLQKVYLTSTLTLELGAIVKIKKKFCKINLRKFSFTNRIVDLWNTLPQSVIDAKDVRQFDSHTEDPVWVPLQRG
jgi:hypothetical protein